MVWPEPSAEPIDLAKAIRLAVAQNRTLARSALGTEIRALDIARADVAFQIDVRPELYLDTEGGQTVAGGGLSASKKWPWGTETIVRSVIAGASGDEALRQRTLQVEISQPLFRNFGTLIQEEPLVQARHDLLSARRALEMEKNNLILSVVQSYETLLQLGRQLQADQASAGRMEKLARLARAKEVLGRTTRVETMRAELLRGQAQYRLEASRQQLAFEQRSFAELLGASPDTVFELKPTVLLEVKIPALDEALRTAFSNRLDYAQALQDAADSARGVKIAGRKLLPGVDLVVRKTWTAGDSLITFPSSLVASTASNRWSVGLSLDMGLNLKEERAALAQAQKNQASSDLGSDIAALAIAREVHQETAAYQRAQAELTIAARNKDLAASRQKLAQRLFELGRSDQFSVTDAEETYLLAENQWLAARADASLAGYRLLHILGTLRESPDDLKPAAAAAAR
jgi:outer membrane protein TolC